MKQISLSEAEFAAKKRDTKRERFRGQMERVTPWGDLLAVFETYYPKGRCGRPPIGLERMRRVSLVQQWYDRPDEGVEDAITDSQALRDFVGIDLTRETVPDATILLKCRHLLEDKDLTKQVSAAIHVQLTAKGLMMRERTIADEMIYGAPPSVKNEAKARDPDIHQTKKGNQMVPCALPAHSAARNRRQSWRPSSLRLLVK